MTSDSAVRQLLQAPDPTTLSEPHVRAKTCVWCTVALCRGTSVVLGERAEIERHRFPRGCRPCTIHHAHPPQLDHTELRAVHRRPDGLRSGHAASARDAAGAAMSAKRKTLQELCFVEHILDDQGAQPRKHHTHKLVDISHASVNDIDNAPSSPNVRQGR
ncbi:hypothetical protein ACFVFJ_24355 [Streptomyces sp. NPDC057717]|uniref:hypothetical protein n=1 Tax=unclassified Streptomyces TaxID=2593676 RepID=UPI00363E8BBA